MSNTAHVTSKTSVYYFLLALGNQDSLFIPAVASEILLKLFIQIYKDPITFFRHWPDCSDC